MRVQLAGATDFDGFRANARMLLAAGVAPDTVAWSAGDAAVDLFGDMDAEAPPPAPSTARLVVPPAFIDLCRSVVLHRDPQRFALLYRLLWRLQHEPALRHDPLDPGMLQAQQMAHAVRRDIHKMRAFVRFREVPDDPEGGVTHVAWFEPDHHIVEANAPWFMRRFTQMRWALLTPDRCAAWDGRTLRFEAGANRADAPPPDAGEQLWLTYYRSIFNPARLKLAMMRKEMPRKYWHNLPEAALIAPLAAQAQERSGRMLLDAPTTPARRIPRTIALTPAEPAHDTLAALNGALQQCRECPLFAAATQAVAGEGPAGAALMLVGEQPGDQEDLAGRPFVGPAGQLLDRALADLGADRSRLYLTNAVRHFKHELRGRRRIHKTASQREAATCAHWLEEEIALVRPGALVALGATAARSLLGGGVSVTRARGTWLRRPDGRAVMVTWHPSALLRLPAGQQEAAFRQFSADLSAALAGAPAPAA
jgi:probable DNA metabolism protein